MEDNSSSDDEVKDSPLSPKMGGKKFKLNDGSSQDSLKEAGKCLDQVSEAKKKCDVNYFWVRFDCFCSCVFE